MNQSRVFVSRHAKRRIQLYRLSEKDIIEIIMNDEEVGRHAVIQNMEGIDYPVKIIYEVKTDETVLITAYPLKRGTK